MQRVAWTDERLDDLSQRMDAGFDRVDRDIHGVRGDVNSGFAGLRQEMKAGDTELRGEMNSGFAGLRQEMKAGDTELRGEMNSGFAELRGEMNSGFAELRGEMKTGDTGLRSEMKAGDTELRGEMKGRIRGTPRRDQRPAHLDVEDDRRHRHQRRRHFAAARHLSPAAPTGIIVA